jgi:hypothetical protein
MQVPAQNAAIRTRLNRGKAATQAAKRARLGFQPRNLSYGWFAGFFKISGQVLCLAQDDNTSFNTCEDGLASTALDPEPDQPHGEEEHDKRAQGLRPDLPGRSGENTRAQF